MLNYVWFALVALAVIFGVVNGRLEAVTKAAFDSAKAAVEIAIGLVGVMTLWLGIVKIAEVSGLVRALARALRPLARRVFPEIPDGHPALGAMLLNISANWLGLGNAATPLGIKAMEELQTLNPEPGVATDAMVTFLAINTASITLVPATIIAVRVSLGSADPTAIVFPTIAASTCATVVAVLSARLLARVPGLRLPASSARPDAAADGEPAERPQP
jgi:spore maturation protein A